MHEAAQQRLSEGLGKEIDAEAYISLIWNTSAAYCIANPDIAPISQVTVAVCRESICKRRQETIHC
jgi:hypothetical protein